MRLIAIDAALRACSVAVRDDGGLRAHDFVLRRRGHGDILAPMIRDVVAESGMGFRQLDAVVVTIGPGSYTGVRIGLAAARGLALAADCAIIGVTTLETVARAAADADGDMQAGMPIGVCLETQRREIYVQHFDPRLTPTCEPAAMLPEAARALFSSAPLLLAGDAAERVREALFAADPDVVSIAPGHGQPDAEIVARIAAERFATVDPAGQRDTPRPLYLRPPSVTVTAANKR